MIEHRKKQKEYGLKTISIRIGGPGAQRESAMRALFGQNFVVTSILDVSSIAHNGVRPPKEEEYKRIIGIKCYR